MRLSEIENKARKIGIKNTWRFSKKELIRTIQKQEGNFDCFDTPVKQTCEQTLCCWRTDCVK